MVRDAPEIPAVVGCATADVERHSRDQPVEAAPRSSLTVQDMSVGERRQKIVGALPCS